MLVKKVYSSTQAVLGACLGGPLASTYFIRQNFIEFENQGAAKLTSVIGSILILFILFVLPLLPQSFPKMIIPVVTIVATRLLVEKFWCNKEDDEMNEQLTYHSNWHVLGVSLVSLVVFLVAGVILLYLMEVLGITTNI